MHIIRIFIADLYCTIEVFYLFGRVCLCMHMYGALIFLFVYRQSSGFVIRYLHQFYSMNFVFFQMNWKTVHHTAQNYVYTNKQHTVNEWERTKNKQQPHTQHQQNQPTRTRDRVQTKGKCRSSCFARARVQWFSIFFLAANTRSSPKTAYVCTEQNSKLLFKNISYRTASTLRPISRWFSSNTTRYKYRNQNEQT